MRICFISHSADNYGAEIALLELLQGLGKIGVECLVLVPGKGPLLDELDRLNIAWKVTPCPPWIARRRRFIIARTIKTLLAVPRIAKILRQSGCDIVYTNTVMTPAGAIAAWISRKPHIWHSHESAFHNPLQRFDIGQRWSTYLVGWLSRKILVASESVRDDYCRYLSVDKMQMIYQSVTLREAGLINKPAKAPFQCIMVASIHPWKGQDQAITALSKLVERGVDVFLLIVGGQTTKFHARLVRQIEALHLKERVRFHGYAENPIPLMRAADILLVCSHWEAFGRVTVEAMLAGTPVIGSARGATPELIQDGVTGLLYEFGNSIQLADKIQFLLENPQERTRLGILAKQWANTRFTQERYAREVFNVLSDVIPDRLDRTTDSLPQRQTMDGLAQPLAPKRRLS